MADVEFRIVHVEHNNTTISIHTPVGDSLRWGYRANDIGDVSYNLALTDTALAIAGPDSFAPYATDWRLGMNVLDQGWETIHGGIHTTVGLKPRSGVVAVSGRDWAHWLEQPVWFEFYNTDFDANDLPGTSHALIDAFNNGEYDDSGSNFNANGFLDGVAYKVWAGIFGATQRSIIRDLVNQSNQGEVLTARFVNITPTFHGSTGWDEPIHYEVFIQDETDIIDHVKNIAALGDPYGFDFYMGHDKQMHFYSTRKAGSTYPPTNVTWTLTTENIIKEVVPDYEWQNNGPLGTYIIGLGPGQPALWKLKFDTDSINLYRKYLRLVRVGDLYNRKLTDVQYATQGLQYIFPHKDIKLPVKPNRLNPIDPGDGFRNHIGDVVHFTWPVPPYHTIDAYFWITQQDYHGDPAGNWICDLGLEQIYGSN